ncbi:phosphopantetheine-binding protein [Actinocrispum wychmicini]|uniref:Phosphopantetheine binding protein n=1 Tax=Actinocrispum wychmicini TaxID=1213861 RepID=A0A4R2JZT8_9PSEU|nr:phosphopantetheine-binding protein [Actinocrispum wychmicini]TCO62829.1 phosphopantetheine binding protein [Actinocrispum wychmicini]
MTSTDVEKLVGEIWEDVLDLDSISSDDDFFELGGDSVQALDVVYRLRAAGCSLKIGDFFTNPTVRTLSAVAAG